MFQARRVPSRRNARFGAQRRQASRRSFTRALRASEQLEMRAMMAGDLNPFHNYYWHSDVNADNIVTPLDALLIVNELNANGSRPLATDSGGAEGELVNSTNLFMDVSGDGYLSPLDALLVINDLNSE